MTDEIDWTDVHLGRAEGGVRGHLGVHLDGANLRRSIVTEDGWVIPTGRRARPGATGGKPAELYRAGWMRKHGGPIRYPQPTEKGKGNQ